jgi:hypothetical protein
LGSHNKAAIRGVAGSGKTILALAKAQETARRGMRTLFLCYNRPLKDWLLQAIPESFGEALTIDTYHGLVEELCRKAGIAFRPEARVGNTDFWRDVAPERLMQACERLGPELLLTTAACGGWRSTPDRRPRRTFVHLSYSCATPFGPAILVTHDPKRKSVGAICCGAQTLSKDVVGSFRPT